MNLFLILSVTMFSIVIIFMGILAALSKVVGQELPVIERWPLIFKLIPGTIIYVLVGLLSAVYFLYSTISGKDDIPAEYVGLSIFIASPAIFFILSLFFKPG